VNISWGAEVILILAFYWSFEVWKNILSVTISGVVGSWYFFSKTKNAPKMPIFYALKRAITYSFGSIVLGSLIVAILKTARYFYRKAKNSRKPWVKLVVLCFFTCIESIIQTFNMYAFVQVAIYGSSYCVAGKNTLKLIKKCGIEAIANDDLTDGLESFFLYLVGFKCVLLVY